MVGRYHYPRRRRPLIGDGMVTINEVLLAVDIRLGAVRVSAWPAADGDGEMRVSVNELIRSVGNTLQT